MDGIRICGPLTTILGSATGADWLQLKVHALETFQRVLEWYSPALGSDEPLESNVRALKRVAIENLGHMVASGPAASVSCHWSNSVNTIVNVILEMEHEEMELNFMSGRSSLLLDTMRSERAKRRTIHPRPLSFWSAFCHAALLLDTGSNGGKPRSCSCNCYTLGGHGLENLDELFYRVQELVLICCPRLTEEEDLLEFMWFEICRSDLRKFSLCFNGPADIVNCKISRELQARALENPSVRCDVRKVLFCLPPLMHVCSDREEI
ncbi:hypothetical protein PsorP6_007588 [Peronosclerospora sorghi]|uniref:Uncharacterized protein n=1 Tax=Peronosclerospora sorghi TaxID=230839 RepID=A0ACC0W7A9_9STRA|nr:hypothetical protein PsorP6_007588 [Peronosclerospora sorghi]